MNQQGEALVQSGGNSRFLAEFCYCGKRHQKVVETN